MARIPEFGTETYPKHKSVRIGKTSAWRCQQCNFVNDGRNTAWGKNGEGLSHVDGDTKGDFKVTSGCAFCGSLNWKPSRPPKVKDDQFASKDRNDTGDYKETGGGD